MIYTVFIGLIVGAVAKLSMPGKDPGGIIVTILLGIAGSFVGTWLGQQLGFYEANQPAGFVASVLGGMLILLAYRLLLKKKSR